jgi:hypothetical protein
VKEFVQVDLQVVCPAELVEAFKELVSLLNRPDVLTGSEGLEAFEKEIRDRANDLCARAVGLKIEQTLESEVGKEAQRQLRDAWPYPLRDKGKETVRLRTALGGEVEVRVSYFARKGRGRRRKRNAGAYLGLLWLGIHDRCTPGLAAEVSLLAAMLGSLKEATEVLAERGVVLDVKGVRQIAYRFAKRARVAQRLEGLEFEQGVRGRRVAVSIDGGRTRLREKKRGPKTAKGRNRYHGAWREPKLFIVYVVDAEGKLERSFLPVLDGLIDKPDALFKLLQGYLQQLGLVGADQVLFIADGAPWIWNRVPALVQALGLKPHQVHELIDFYHAVEHLGKVAALRKSWTAKQRKRWVNRQRKRLLQGQVEKVVAGVRAICRGRNSKAIRTQREYFVKNAARMLYDRVRALKLPIGSGCVESAIRRVINLRLKGPCIFWCRANAEAILLLRCYWKAGRWNMLKKQANSVVPEAYA